MVILSHNLRFNNIILQINIFLNPLDPFDQERDLRGPADLRRSKFRETSLFLKKFSLSRVAFEKM